LRRSMRPIRRGAGRLAGAFDQSSRGDPDGLVHFLSTAGVWLSGSALAIAYPFKCSGWRWIGWASALRQAPHARPVWRFPRGDLSQTQSQRLREAIAMTAIGRYVSRLSGPGMDRRRTVPGSRNALQGSTNNGPERTLGSFVLIAYLPTRIRSAISLKNGR
jgi:hypothetical protein